MAKKPTPPVIDAAPGLRQRQRANGTWRVWWEPTAAMLQAGAKPIDLNPAKPADAARQAQRLHAQWLAALNGGAKPDTRGRTMTDLIADYQRSRRFTTRAATTQRSYAIDLKQIATKWGSQPVALFDAPTMDVWYESLLQAKGEFRAAALLRMASVLFAHAEKIGWRPRGTNPCEGIEVIKPASRSRLLTDAERAALLTAADALGDDLVALALRLALASGQRQTDVLTATAAEFTAAEVPVAWSKKPVPVRLWHFTRSKRGNAGVAPILDVDLVARLDTAIAAARAAGRNALFVNGVGLPFTIKRWNERWHRVRDAAAKTCPSLIGDAPLQWRDLRRTFATTARANGASKDDVGDMIGNTAAINSQLAAVYMIPHLDAALRAAAAAQLPQAKGKKA